jgi:hypothetical protein
MAKLMVSTFVLASLTLFGCGENEQLLAPDTSYVRSIVTWVTVRPIIANYCSRCHATFMDQSEANQAAAEIVDILEENPMHGIGALDVMNNTERNMLLDWANGVKK